MVTEKVTGDSEQAKPPSLRNPLRGCPTPTRGITYEVDPIFAWRLRRGKTRTSSNMPAARRGGSPNCPGMTEPDEVHQMIFFQIGLGKTGIGWYIISNRLRDGLWVSTNPRNEANGDAGW